MRAGPPHPPRMDPFTLTPLLIGLASALHCVGMCGGIIGALSLGLDPAVRARRGRLLAHVAAYNLGRVFSYAAAGALVGGLGAGLAGGLAAGTGNRLLALASATWLVAIGLHLAGWFPAFARVEHLGRPLWQRLEPIGRRLLPVRSPWQALAFGLVWGWLPCGLVYATLLLATAAGSAGGGALYMALFGLGTLPATLATGLFAGWFARLGDRARLRRLIGAALIAFGLGWIWLGPELAAWQPGQAPGADLHQGTPDPRH